MAVWMLVVGACLLVLVAYDAVATTLSTSNPAGPLTARLWRTWWRIARRAARGPHSGWLKTAGPGSLVVTATVWLLLLWTGWTLVFSADPDAVVSATTRSPADWSERAYFAGYTAFTLGVGDYVPVGAVWQLLTVVASVSGLALTTVAITYLVPVVTAVTQRRQQASNIAALGQDGTEIVTSSWHEGSVRYLEPVLIQLTSSLLLTAERHLAYPVLHAFHSSSRRGELRVQVVALDDALTLVEHGMSDGVRGPHPAAVSGARRAIAQLVERAGVGKAQPAPIELGPLRDAGIPTVDDETFRERVRALTEHRERLAAYSAESAWDDPSALRRG